MNVILVLIDSLNRHMLSPYQRSQVATPNLDAFARRAWRMNNHFVGSLPCMPARREIFAGFKEMMWRIWGPLEYPDFHLPRLVEAAGHATAIVTDHYHYWEESGNGYLQSFQSAELIRGHETDFWKQPLREQEPLPDWVQQIEFWRRPQGRIYYSNVRDFGGEEDFFPARTFSGAARWLRENAARGSFYLHVESFDVHEPFHVPEPYASMYWDAPRRSDAYTLWPPYQDPDQLHAWLSNAPPDAVRFVQSQYMGKLTMVDRWFGELTRAIDELNLWDNTAVIITTDHGHDLSQHNKFGKEYPHYDTHAHIPLFIWHPAYPGSGATKDSLTQTVDLFATVLDVMGLPQPGKTHSRSILPLLSGDTSKARAALLYGTFGQGVCLTDGEWTVFKSPDQVAPLYLYTTQLYKSLIARGKVQRPVGQGFFIPTMDYPQWQIPMDVRMLSHENFLFNRKDDPEQNHNRWADQPKPRERMVELLRAHIDLEGAPAEQYVRLGLS